MIYLTPANTAAVRDLIDEHPARLGALVTPRTWRPQLHSYDRWTWAADNDCFSLAEKFELGSFVAWLEAVPAEARARCVFATAPDVVGDWSATVERSTPALPLIRAAGFPAGLVAQDGLEDPDDLPWGDFDVLFLGGTTDFKLGRAAARCAMAAAERGLWVHMGRVNSELRTMRAAAIGCRSVDGTHLVFEARAKGGSGAEDGGASRVLRWAERAERERPLLPGW